MLLVLTLFMLAVVAEQLNQVARVERVERVGVAREQVIRELAVMQLITAEEEVQVHLVLQVERAIQELLSSYILKAVQCM